MKDGKSTSQAMLFGESTGVIINGTFKFENLIIYGEILNNFTLKVQSNIETPDSPFEDFNLKNELVLNKQYYYYYPIKISECAYGQILKNLSGTNLLYCFSCSAGTYSININEECSVCIQGADCSSGILITLPSFWRISKVIIQCVPLGSSCL